MTINIKRIGFVSVIFCLCLDSYRMQAKAKDNGSATVHVKLEQMPLVDTLSLMYFENYLFNEPSQNGDYIELDAVMSTDSLYTFKFPITEITGYFFVARKILDDEGNSKGNVRFYQISNLLIADGGDDVTINIRQKDTKATSIFGRYSFTCQGYGKEKFNLRFQTDSILYYTVPSTKAIFDSNYEYNPDNSMRGSIKYAISFLESRKTMVTDFHYQLIKADLLFSKAGIYDMILGNFKEVPENKTDLFLRSYENSIGNINLYNMSPVVLVRSKQAVNYFLAQARATVKIMGQDDDPEALYGYILDRYQGQIRDKLLVYYFYRSIVSHSSLTSNLQKAVNIMEDPICLAALKTIKEQAFVSVFEKDHTFSAMDNKAVKLSDYGGEVLLVDFWFTGCAFCSKFVKEQLVDVEKQFASNPNVIFVSISIDRNKTTWLRSVKNGEYTLPSSINLYTSKQGNNHSLIKELNIKGYPTLMILDKQGNIIELGVAEENNTKLYKSNLLIDLIKSHL